MKVQVALALADNKITMLSSCAANDELLCQRHWMSQPPIHDADCLDVVGGFIYILFLLSLWERLSQLTIFFGKRV